MKKSFALFFLILVSAHTVWAQNDALHVVKSSINAEADNAEFCLEFDHTLTSLSHLGNALRLESDGKKITPQNIEANGSSVCMFPLDRDRLYHIEATGLHGEGARSVDVRLAAPYTLSFTIPDRAPSLTFARKKYSNGFATYDAPLTLRAVNVDHVKLSVYRVTDIPTIAHAWQDRAQILLAPSESVYLAKNKGQQVWQGDKDLAGTPNIMFEQSLALPDLLPNLTPGLYLIVADAGKEDDSSLENKGVAPLAATWFTKSDFSLRAIHDEDGLHIFSSKANIALRVVAFNKNLEQLAETKNGADGSALIPYPLKSGDSNDVTTLVGIDAQGNIAAADNDALPPVSKAQALGQIHQHALFAVPGDAVDLTLSASENQARISDQSKLRLLRSDSYYADFSVPAPTANMAKLSFAAPFVGANWKMRWQKNDGTNLAETALRVTSNLDAPHLEAQSDREFVTSEAAWPITIKSVTDSGKPAVLIGGNVRFSWQKQDPAAIGWKDYRFGMPAALLDTSFSLSPFLTDLQGITSLHLTLPKPPIDPGLYQAALTVVADPDTGVETAKPLIVPLRSDATVIGIKPLAANARFPQNGMARFALIGLSSEEKSRDVSGLSYQIYEEGRSFDWYQDDGRWNYKPEPHLRPIGGGALSIKGDGSSVLEWPVTAGNYRLEILESDGKKLAETNFSAGWDAVMPVAAPLAVTLPKTLHPGQDALAHVTLPEPMMLTAIIADQHIRKVIHENRDKGDNTIAFTPTADWQNTLNVMVDATPATEQSPPLSGIAQATIIQTTSNMSVSDTGIAITASPDPAAMIVRKGEKTTLTFGIENLGDTTENYRYALTVSPGVKIESGDKGSFTLGGKQSRALFVTIFADQPGVKEIQLDVASAHTSRINRTWVIDILPKEYTLSSLETYDVPARENLFKKRAAATGALAFVSRHPMDGLAELMTFVFNAAPYTTNELALSIDTMRLWGNTLAQTGFASDQLIKARQHQWMMQLLGYQNMDGGFGNIRGDDSTMDHTAEALIALGLDSSEQTVAAKNLAVSWLKQRLSNTWFDDKERTSRAAAFAALAAADAIDPANLHYFSDTSATQILSPIAEANTAAAFKHIHDPNAAAFWIKKMLDEKGDTKSIPMLNALAATDALSSDDVHGALAAAAAKIRQGEMPTIEDATGLLRALAADDVDTGKWKIFVGKETNVASGVYVLRAADVGTLSATNIDSTSLSVTYVVPGPAPVTKTSLARHIYRLNGVEMSPQTVPAQGEIYLVELKGTLPAVGEDKKTLLQVGSDSSLRPIGCPLSDKLNAMSFMPWLTLDDVTPTSSCQLLPYSLSMLISPDDKSDNNKFRVLYFTYIDAPSLAALQPPQLRIIH